MDNGGGQAAAIDSALAPGTAAGHAARICLNPDTP
jgi:hypothetical protein